MTAFLDLYEHDQFQNFRQLIEDALNSLTPKVQPFIGLPKEMKVKYKKDQQSYQRYVKQRVCYINEREQKRRQFIKWCSKEVIEQFIQIYPEMDYVRIVVETISGLNELFLERYESITSFSLEINF